MFALAYVILPFTELDPSEAIRTSLARFERGVRGEIPSDWVEFDDYSGDLMSAYREQFTFSLGKDEGLQIVASPYATMCVEPEKVRKEMKRRGFENWQVTFADTVDFDDFYNLFCIELQRNPKTGAYGQWRNLLGHWDWWDLGGCFDGRIIGETGGGLKRTVSQISSGDNPGRMILSNLHRALEQNLDQAPAATSNVRSDRNIELVSTLLADARAGRENAFPSALILPPGSVRDELRWVDTWPKLGPATSLEWLGLTSDANWPTLVEKAYVLFEDCWIAAIAYHH